MSLPFRLRAAGHADPSLASLALSRSAAAFTASLRSESIRMLGILIALLGLSSPSSATEYVSVSDPTCGGQAPCHADIQSAVDAAADGEEILVAAGTYSGVSTVDVGGIDYHQVVLVAMKNLTIRGGFTESDWSTADPVTNPTTIDAMGLGRGMTVIGSFSESVTVSGLTFTGGDYTDLGNPDGVGNQACSRTASDCGGGLFATAVQLVLLDSVFDTNTGGSSPLGDGGGAYLWATLGGTRIENVAFTGNSAPGTGAIGGGLHATKTADVTILDCLFEGNSSWSEGAGLHAFQPSGTFTVRTTEFVVNEVTGHNVGGGLSVNLTAAGTALDLDRVTLRDNIATFAGAALAIEKSGPSDSTAELTNLVVLGHESSSTIWVEHAFGGLALEAAHLTVVGHDFQSAFEIVSDSDGDFTGTFENVLLETAGVGFEADRQGAGALVVDHTRTLSWNVTTLELTAGGSPTFVSSGGVVGDPLLTTDGHLSSAASAAFDAGIDAGVLEDIDGDVRPGGAAPDIGADEVDAPFFADGFESGDTSAWTVL